MGSHAAPATVASPGSVSSATALHLAAWVLAARQGSHHPPFLETGVQGDWLQLCLPHVHCTPRPPSASGQRGQGLGHPHCPECCPAWHPYLLAAFAPLSRGFSSTIPGPAFLPGPGHRRPPGKVLQRELCLFLFSCWLLSGAPRGPVLGHRLLTPSVASVPTCDKCVRHIPSGLSTSSAAQELHMRPLDTPQTCPCAGIWGASEKPTLFLRPRHLPGRRGGPERRCVW